MVRCEIASLSSACFSFSILKRSAAGNVKPLKVLIACNGEDIPGERVCSALKEKIRASVGFELVQLIDNADFCVHMVSVDLGSENLSSAMAVIFTTTAPDRISGPYRERLSFPDRFRLEVQRCSYRNGRQCVR